MSFKVQGVDHVAVRVKNLDLAMDFYTRILGLAITQREYSKPGIEFFLDCGSSLIALIQGDSQGKEHPFDGKGMGADHVSFRVNPQDFDYAVEELKQKGVEVLFSKKREKSWSVYFRDPDGNKLEITAWPLEPSWDLMPILQKASQGKGLSPEEVGALLKQNQPAHWDEIFRIAKDLTERNFHKKLHFFAPLYFSNYCVNDCAYCGFRRSNHQIKRRALSVDEFINEARFLWDQGHRSLLLIAGEHPIHAGLGDIASYVCALARENLHFSLLAEIAPLPTAEYRVLRDLGIQHVLLFQETYNREAYARYHWGLKSDYDWRIKSMERAGKAGIEKIGMGILLGLHFWREDLVDLIRHAWHLKKEFGSFPATFSFPRLQPAPGVSLACLNGMRVSDDDFKKIIALTRLAIPESGIVLSTRETADFRTKLLEESIGITHMSAGSCTTPGGYTLGEKEPSGQFEIVDHRSLPCVKVHANALGYESDVRNSS